MNKELSIVEKLKIGVDKDQVDIIHSVLESINELTQGMSVLGEEVEKAAEGLQTGFSTIGDKISELDPNAKSFGQTVAEMWSKLESGNAATGAIGILSDYVGSINIAQSESAVLTGTLGTLQAAFFILKSSMAVQGTLSAFIALTKIAIVEEGVLSGITLMLSIAMGQLSATIAGVGAAMVSLLSNPVVLILAGIAGVIFAITKLNKKEKELREEREKNRKEIIKNSDAIKAEQDDIDKLNSLLEEHKKLKEKSKEQTEEGIKAKKRLHEVEIQLAKLMPETADAIDQENNKLLRNSELIEENIKMKKKAALVDAKMRIDSIDEKKEYADLKKNKEVYDEFAEILTVVDEGEFLKRLTEFSKENKEIISIDDVRGKKIGGRGSEEYRFGRDIKDVKELANTKFKEIGVKISDSVYLLNAHNRDLGFFNRNSEVNSKDEFIRDKDLGLYVPSTMAEDRMYYSDTSQNESTRNVLKGMARDAEEATGQQNKNGLIRELLDKIEEEESNLKKESLKEFGISLTEMTDSQRAFYRKDSFEQDHDFNDVGQESRAEYKGITSPAELKRQREKFDKIVQMSEWLDDLKSRSKDMINEQKNVNEQLLKDKISGAKKDYENEMSINPYNYDVLIKKNEVIVSRQNDYLAFLYERKNKAEDTLEFEKYNNLIKEQKGAIIDSKKEKWNLQRDTLNAEIEGNNDEIARLKDEANILNLTKKSAEERIEIYEKISEIEETNISLLKDQRESLKSQLNEMKDKEGDYDRALKVSLQENLKSLDNEILDHTQKEISAKMEQRNLFFENLDKKYVENSQHINDLQTQYDATDIEEFDARKEITEEILNLQKENKAELEKTQKVIKNIIEDLEEKKELTESERADLKINREKYQENEKVLKKQEQIMKETKENYENIMEDKIKLVKSTEDEIVEIIKQSYEEKNRTLKESREEEWKELQKKHKDKLDAIEEEKEAFEDLINDRIKQLDRAKEKEEHNDELKDLTEKKLQIQAEIDAVSMDDSSEGKMARALLVEKLQKIEEDIDKVQDKYTYKIQKQNYQDELDNYRSVKDGQIDKEKSEHDIEKEKYEKDMDNLEKIYIKSIESGNLYREARRAIENGFFLGLQGEQLKISGAIEDIKNTYADGFSSMGETIKSELIDNLEKVRELIGEITDYNETKSLKPKDLNAIKDMDTGSAYIDGKVYSLGELNSMDSDEVDKIKSQAKTFYVKNRNGEIWDRFGSYEIDIMERYNSNSKLTPDLEVILKQGEVTNNTVDIKVENLINIEGSIDEKSLPDIEATGAAVLSGLQKELNKNGLYA